MNTSPSILVTGGAGYIGSVLVPELLARGYHVTVVDNFLFQQVSLAHICADSNFTLVRGDVRDESRGCQPPSPSGDAPADVIRATPADANYQLRLWHRRAR